jgi:DNA-binding NtrC family response regulator
VRVDPLSTTPNDGRVPALSNESALVGRKILIVDDHEPHRNLLANYLGAVGCKCTGAGGGNEALARMAAQPFDLVLLDLRMDDLDGMEVLKRARAQGLAHNCIMMSAEGTISHAVEAIRLGARDFLVKPFELEQLHETVQRVLGGPLPGAPGARDPRSLWRDTHAPGLIGEAPSLLEVFLVLERIAHTDCTVLVLGESGTGKELVARAVHHASHRQKKPFVPVNCGAIPETLIESELFGHAKGAFSGATQARDGRFAVADGGTLFLDEIGEMSLSVQVKFLRVLQEKEFVPVGETRPRKCDVRIIAATNKNLEKMAEAGAFREDLFYRLNLIPIHLPSLRERLVDVPDLVNYFIEKVADRRGSMVECASPEALDCMMRYAWPGNVRELENTVERMTLLHQGSGVLDVEDLPAKIQLRARRAPPPTDGAHPHLPVLSFSVAPSDAAERPTWPSDSPAGPLAPEIPRSFRLPDEGINLRDAVEAFEMSLIEQALDRTGGNKNQASILLGMNRTTLVEKLRKRDRKVKS